MYLFSAMENVQSAKNASTFPLLNVAVYTALHLIRLMILASGVFNSISMKSVIRVFCLSRRYLNPYFSSI